MKISTAFVAALLFTAALGAVNNAVAADGVLLKQESTPGSYCHTQFQAIRQSTLGDESPVLKNSSSGDVIDYYGSCDVNPLGQDEIQAQKLEDQHRWAHDYED